ncbi:hypothetical protein NP233_g9651 [Leucocoprinus birnbaumii]|uniref:Uncharacterized protein n=1 Tax=Leucocoprinus birnbaumii TaxID=56174 RepID=A0AAD5YSM8_9AGAR|nr:hypothetical protein NP233_g9651 [Leucocoprinus birnbaumii]
MMEKPTLIVIGVASLATGTVIGIFVYAVFSMRRRLAKRKADRLVPRRFSLATSITPSMGVETPSILEPGSDKMSNEKKTPKLPSRTLMYSLAIRRTNKFLPQEVFQAPRRHNRHGRDSPREQKEEPTHLTGGEELSRQTTQYSVTSTLIAETGSRPTTPHTPNTSRTPKRHSMQKRKFREIVSIPPVLNFPLPVLEVPTLSEPFNSDEFIGFAWSRRWSTAARIRGQDTATTVKDIA